MVILEFFFSILNQTAVTPTPTPIVWNVVNGGGTGEAQPPSFTRAMKGDIPFFPRTSLGPPQPCAPPPLPHPAAHSCAHAPRLLCTSLSIYIPRVCMISSMCALHVLETIPVLPAPGRTCPQRINVHLVSTRHPCACWNIPAVHTHIHLSV